MYTGGRGERELSARARELSAALSTAVDTLDRCTAEREEAVHRENIKTQEELSAVRDRIYREEESLKRAEAQLRNRTEALEKERQETGKLRKQRLEMEVTRQQKKREVEDLEKALGSLQSRLNNATHKSLKIFFLKQIWSAL